MADDLVAGKRPARQRPLLVFVKQWEESPSCPPALVINLVRSKADG